MMYKKILTICFSLVLFTSCNHVSPVSKAWVKPNKPSLQQPIFLRVEDGLYLQTQQAVILRNNIVEMHKYQKKLELLVEEMLKYYTK